MVCQAIGDSSSSPNSATGLERLNRSSTTSDQHEQLMRQQFSSNNMRSRAVTTSSSTTSDYHHHHHNHHHHNRFHSSSPLSQQPIQRTSRAASPHHQIRYSELATATTSQSYVLNDSSSSNRQQQQHMNRALDDKLARVAISSLYNTTTPNPLDNGWDSSVVMPNNCLNPDRVGANGGHQHDCGESNITSQMSLLNIRTDELNFSEIKDVWLVKDWQEILVRVSFVAPIVLLGLIGNLTIIYSMYRFKKIRSKPTNIFILNMALADLLTTIVCPNAALLTDIFQFYVLGSFVCRFEGFIKITCLLVSAYSLIVLSFDWFLSVVKPCRRRITIRQSWLTLVSIWIVSVAMALPLLYWRSLRQRQWKDLVEVWCCELIQYTKYYWVGITLFLIYLPTVVMTIVLIVILAQMDKFEAKLKRTRKPAAVAMNSNNNQRLTSLKLENTATATTTTANSVGGGHIHSISFGGTTSSSQNGSDPSRDRLNSSLSITMRYRRRIVKILFFYLLTSIICWTPLQFIIIYRHFRTEAVPASWFFELAFYSQLCASLSAAMNPIIFGFLSLPFRRVVTKSWMFRILDKVWTTNNKTNSKSGVNGKVNGGNNQQNGSDQRRLGGQHQLIAVVGNNNINYGVRHESRRTTRIDENFDQAPKLTIEYIEHENQQVSDRVTSAMRGVRFGASTTNNNSNDNGVAIVVANTNTSTGRYNRAYVRNENDKEEPGNFGGGGDDDDDDDDDDDENNEGTENDDATRPGDLSQEHMQIKMKHLNSEHNHNNNNISMMRDHYNHKKQQM